LAVRAILETRMIANSGQTLTFDGIRFEFLRKRRLQLVSIKVTPLKRSD